MKSTPGQVVVAVVVGILALVAGGVLALRLDGTDAEPTTTATTQFSSENSTAPAETEPTVRTSTTTTTVDVVAQQVDAKLAALTLEEKAGQLVMLAFSGDAAEPVLGALANAHVANVFVTNSHGNVVDANALRALVAEIQVAANAALGLGMFIATDQEGGNVERIAESGSRTPRLWGEEVAARGEAALEEYRVEVRDAAEDLCFAGITMNFAPLLDVVADVAASEAIGDRSFGGDPSLVTQLASVAFEEYDEVRILAVAKHWPGHGATNLDSHETLPVLEIDRSVWEAVHAAPYRAAIEQGVGAVMVGHLDASTVFAVPSGPATFSEGTIDGVLRSEFGFDGLVVTDDLSSMVAANVDGLSIGQRAVAAVAAGADIALFSGSGAPDDAVAGAQALVTAVSDGTLSSEMFDAAVRRVLVAKQAIGLLDLPMPDFAGCVPTPAIP